jgi:hypothetical protein
VPLAVRRVGGTTPYQQTYTLGPQEAFRLDAVNFAIGFAYDGQVLDPTLRIQNAGGLTVAEITATQEDILGPPGFSSFDYSGPAVFSDDEAIQPPLGYYGYGLHDFGAGPTSSQITVDNPSTQTRQTGVAFTWLRSAGAVTIAPKSGTASGPLTETLTATLTAAAPAGSYLLLAMTYLDEVSILSDQGQARPTVTDTVGGNVLDYSGFTTWAFNYKNLTTPTGEAVHCGSVFYRIVNPLGIGDKVTVKLNNSDPLWFGLNAHVVTGLTVGNPIGPNAGGNYTGFSEFPNTLPFTTSRVPTPVWTGGVLFAGLATVPRPNTLDVCMARGQTYFAQQLSGIFGPGPDFTQMALPELDLGPNDTITVLALDADGTPRVGDVVSDFLVYGLDE